jgi:hypothetical protein
MTTQFVDSVEEMFNQPQTLTEGGITIELTEKDVQLLADRIVEEILQMGQKSISKKKIEKIVALQLEKVGV